MLVFGIFTKHVDMVTENMVTYSFQLMKLLERVKFKQSE